MEVYSIHNKQLSTAQKLRLAYILIEDAEESVKLQVIKDENESEKYIDIDGLAYAILSGQFIVNTYENSPPHDIIVEGEKDHEIHKWFAVNMLRVKEIYNTKKYKGAIWACSECDAIIKAGEEYES